MNSNIKFLFKVTLIFTTYTLSADPLPYYILTDSDFYPRNPAKEQLGRLLMFDKILSGNKNIACATCHHPFTATGDGLSLPVGEGGQGLGKTRNTGNGADKIIERVPRNAPPLFNLGARQFEHMFHDGRIAPDPSHFTGFLSPAGDQLPLGLDNPLAVQAMFPVTSNTEMAGQAGENPIADQALAGNLSGPGGVWPLLAQRIRQTPGYIPLFINAFDDIQSADDIHFIHIANALAAFEAQAWRCTDSLFDRYVKDQDSQLVSQEVMAGADIFYNPSLGNCVACHNGPLQTDHRFHAIGMPQIGPGKGDNQEGYDDGLDDFGRERVTGNIRDRFRFRTPSLRQVALTGPWGHDGAFNSLEAIIRHHLNPEASLNNYDVNQAQLPKHSESESTDFKLAMDPKRKQALADATDIVPKNLNDQQIQLLIEFLTRGLTDTQCLNLNRDIPESVPSGLPIAD